jgi:hypothetical protein
LREEGIIDFFRKTGDWMVWSPWRLQKMNFLQQGRSNEMTESKGNVKRGNESSREEKNELTRSTLEASIYIESIEMVQRNIGFRIFKFKSL